LEFRVNLIFLPSFSMNCRLNLFVLLWSNFLKFFKLCCFIFLNKIFNIFCILTGWNLIEKNIRSLNMIWIVFCFAINRIISTYKDIRKCLEKQIQLFFIYRIQFFWCLKFEIFFPKFEIIIFVEFSIKLFCSKLVGNILQMFFKNISIFFLRPFYRALIYKNRHLAILFYDTE
jgi:hypothetical protein